MSGFGIFRAFHLRLGRVIVEGISMQPTYNPNDWLLVRYRSTGSWPRPIRVGKIVVIEREVQPGIFYIKRVAEVVKNEENSVTYFLRSDNEAGTDSRQWGYLRGDEVVATVVGRIKGSRLN
jgi:signal peptidase I